MKAGKLRWERSPTQRKQLVLLTEQHSSTPPHARFVAVCTTLARTLCLSMLKQVQCALYHDRPKSTSTTVGVPCLVRHTHHDFNSWPKQARAPSNHSLRAQTCAPHLCFARCKQTQDAVEVAPPVCTLLLFVSPPLASFLAAREAHKASNSSTPAASGAQPLVS